MLVSSVIGRLPSVSLSRSLGFSAWIITLGDKLYKLPFPNLSFAPLHAERKETVQFVPGCLPELVSTMHNYYAMLVGMPWPWTLEGIGQFELGCLPLCRKLACGISSKHENTISTAGGVPKGCVGMCLGDAVAGTFGDILLPNVLQTAIVKTVKNLKCLSSCTSSMARWTSALLSLSLL